MNKYLVHWTYVANHSDAPFLVNASSPFEAAEKVAMGFSDDFRARATLHVHCVSVGVVDPFEFPGMYTRIQDGKEIVTRIQELY